MLPPLRFPDFSGFFEYPRIPEQNDSSGENNASSTVFSPRFFFNPPIRDDEDLEEDDDDDDDEEEDEMEQIGRLPSLNQISLEYYHVLFNRYIGSILQGFHTSVKSNLQMHDSDDTAPELHQQRPGPSEVQEENNNSASDAEIVPPGDFSENNDDDDGEFGKTSVSSIASLTDLRQRIIEIKELNLPDRERDRRVQQLMTETYYKLHPPRSEQDLQVTNRDCSPTFNEESGVLGCEHYRRRCKLECSTCGRWYTCRFCHDEVEMHKLIRPQTRHMLCMNCGTAQESNQNCTNCKLQMARYYCDHCKLWDDDPDKSIYHCQACGICRIGKGLGIDFFHCSTCNMCMSIELQGNHKCIEHSTECDCPICGEFMFTSTETVIFMKCGHSIHQSCFNEHTKSSYRCPTCARSILNMEAQFRILDTEIANQLLPEPYNNWRSIIICNDCSAKSDTPFHFLGLKCQNCKSYNTSQDELIKPEEQQADNDDHQHEDTGQSQTQQRHYYSVDEATNLINNLNAAVTSVSDDEV